MKGGIPAEKVTKTKSKVCPPATAESYAGGSTMDTPSPNGTTMGPAGKSPVGFSGSPKGAPKKSLTAPPGGMRPTAV